LSKNLFDKILKTASKINKYSRRGVGNYIVTSQVVSDMINGLDKRSERMYKIKNIFNE
jgi:hypothetical protein